MPTGPALDLLSWTEAYRRIGDAPLRPSDVPWLRDLYRDTSPEVWVMKASQVFISEWLESVALWCADTGYAKRGNALYVFPTQSQMDDFAQARVGKAIEESPHLLDRVGKANSEGARGAARVRLKRLGRGHIYFRGADNRRQIISVDADCVLFDEVDEFKAGVIDVARKRLNSSLAPLIRGGSTPKFPSSGIAPIYQRTTRSRYFLTCDGCGERQALAFPDNLTRDGRLVCKKCGHGLDQRGEGEWVAENRTAPTTGYHVSRLYSPRADLKALAALAYAIEDGLVSDQSAIQEMHNQDLGEPYAPEGGSLNDDVLKGCVAVPPYQMPAQITKPPVAMGVDVGAVLHVWIKCIAPTNPDSPLEPGTTRLLYAATTTNWADLDFLMERFKVQRCVIDGNPEQHKAMAFASRHVGKVFCCYYPNMTDWPHREAVVWKPSERIVNAHRTRSMDAMFARFYQKLEQLPVNAEAVGGLYEQMKAPIRVISKDANGRPVARYDEGTAADHYAHAANYAHVAWCGVVGIQPIAPTPVSFNSAGPEPDPMFGAYGQRPARRQGAR